MADLIQIRNIDPLSGGKVEVGAPAPAAPSMGYTLIVRRGTARDPFLGPEGWQQVEHSFVAQSFEIAGDRILLQFGTDVVDNAIRVDDVVQLTIPELDVTDVVVWTGITPSVTLEDVTRTAAPITPEGGTSAGLAEPPKRVPRPEPPRPQPPEPEPTGRSWIWLVLLLLAIGAAGYWWFSQQGPTEIAVIEEPEPTQEEITPAEPTTDVVLSAYERGLSAFENNECDTARLAMQEAINEGSGPAMLFWAQQQDSLEFEACITQSANDIRALDFYKQACAANADDVLTHIEALETFLQRKADNGDVVAMEVLRIMLPATKTACGT